MGSTKTLILRPQSAAVKWQACKPWSYASPKLCRPTGVYSVKLVKFWYLRQYFFKQLWWTVQCSFAILACDCHKVFGLMATYKQSTLSPTLSSSTSSSKNHQRQMQAWVADRGNRDAKSGRSGRYICAIFFQPVLIFGLRTRKNVPVPVLLTPVSTDSVSPIYHLYQ